MSEDCKITINEKWIKQYVKFILSDKRVTKAIKDGIENNESAELLEALHLLFEAGIIGALDQHLNTVYEKVN